MAEEVPDHIEDSDFDYLQSKIPAYELLHNDFINVQNNSIGNLSKDDRKQKVISEIWVLHLYSNKRKRGPIVSVIASQFKFITTQEFCREKI